MSESIFSRCNLLGYVMVSYTLLKLLGPHVAILFARLYSEYKEAQKSELLFDERFFIISFNHLAEILNFNIECVKNCLEQLRELGFIGLYSANSACPDIRFIELKKDDISSYLDIEEKKNKFKTWNYKLYNIQEWNYEPEPQLCSVLQHIKDNLNDYKIYFPDSIYMYWDWYVPEAIKENPEAFLEANNAVLERFYDKASAYGYKDFWEFLRDLFIG